MANYSNLKAAIADVIKTNGTKAITGQVLQDTLNSIVSVIGANYQFAGVATPSTNPGTPDQNVFYVAMQGGTYTNFNATALPEGISLLMWNGSWSSQVISYNDGGVFDISVYKSTGGTLATFADLAAALGTNGANVPVAVRKGGMSVKFVQSSVQSSDNKYVQYMCKSSTWSTISTDWERINNVSVSQNTLTIGNNSYDFAGVDNRDSISSLSDLDSLPNGIVSFVSSTIPSGLPSLNYGDGAMIFTTRINSGTFSDFDRQFLITKDAICTRVYYSNSWQNWMVNLIPEPEVVCLGIVYDNLSIDNCASGVYEFTASDVPSGLPSLNYGDGAILYVFRKNNNSLSNWDRQIITANLNPAVVYTRVYYSGSWQNWVKREFVVPEMSEVISLGAPASIDINSLSKGVYTFTSGDSTIISGLNLNYSDGAILYVFRNNNTSWSNFDRLIVTSINNPGVTCTRVYYSGEWSNWVVQASNKRVIKCGANQEYTTLKAAIAEAIRYNGTTVYVYPGTYDLTQEFATELTNQSGSGILLCNDVHVVFMSGAYVTCLVDVTNEWAYHHFEPFRITSVGNGNFILENANIHCKNTRYCVHDEASGADCQYHHKYLNCTMEQYDENPIAYYTQCIGGGLGSNGYIEVIGGKYKSSSLYYQTEHYTSPDDMQMPITYHNGNNAVCDCKIIIKDVYLVDKGYLRFGNYGPSTILTPVFVSGCRMYKPVFLMNETWSPSQVQNFEVFSFNNEVVNP